MGPILHKLDTGGKHWIKSVKLPNGNLCILKRPAEGGEHVWTEVAPGTSDYKRWKNVAVDEPDPRGGGRP